MSSTCQLRKQQKENNTKKVAQKAIPNTNLKKRPLQKMQKVKPKQKLLLRRKKRLLPKLHPRENQLKKKRRARAWE